MPVSFAILLDGGFLRRKAGSTRQPVDAAGIRSGTEPMAAKLRRYCRQDTWAMAEIAHVLAEGERPGK